MGDGNLFHSLDFGKWGDSKSKAAAKKKNNNWKDTADQLKKLKEELQKSKQREKELAKKSKKEEKLEKKNLKKTQAKKNSEGDSQKDQEDTEDHKNEAPGDEKEEEPKTIRGRKPCEVFQAASAKIIENNREEHEKASNKDEKPKEISSNNKVDRGTSAPLIERDPLPRPYIPKTDSFDSSGDEDLDKKNFDSLVELRPEIERKQQQDRENRFLPRIDSSKAKTRWKEPRTPSPVYSSNTGPRLKYVGTGDKNIRR